MSESGTVRTESTAVIGGNAFQYVAITHICISLLLTYLISELLGMNRFLRAWNQGNAFAAYTVVLYTALGLTLGLTLLRSQQRGQMALGRMLLLGLLTGYLCGIGAILLSPLLQGEGFAPAKNALKHPLYLMAAGTLRMRTSRLPSSLNSCGVYSVERADAII
jgi:hypothetical protein